MKLVYKKFSSCPHISYLLNAKNKKFKTFNYRKFKNLLKPNISKFLMVMTKFKLCILLL